MSLCLTTFFLDIEVILNMLKATTGILYLVNIILLSIAGSPVLSLLRDLYYIVAAAKAENGSVT